MKTLNANVPISSRRANYFQALPLIETIYKTKSENLAHRIRYYLKQSLLPFSPILIEGVLTDADKKVIIKIIEEFNELIYKKEFTSVNLETIENSLRELHGLFKSPNIPVNMIRNMLDWTYIIDNSKTKFVIIDRVDYLDRSSENILLKRLEEPPPHLHFILIAENKNNIIQTIRSRCRSVYFPPLQKESVRLIIQKQYENNDEDLKSYDTLADFFHQEDPLYMKNLSSKVEKLIQIAFDKTIPFSHLQAFLKSEKDKEVQFALLVQLKQNIEAHFLDRQFTHVDKATKNNPILFSIRSDTLTYYVDYLQELIRRAKIYNMNLSVSIRISIFN